MSTTSSSAHSQPEGACSGLQAGSAAAPALRVGMPVLTPSRRRGVIVGHDDDYGTFKVKMQDSTTRARPSIATFSSHYLTPDLQETRRIKIESLLGPA